MQLNSDIKAKNQRGFTLLELSMVLAIAGLVIAGVASGVVFMKNARLNNVIADVKRFTKAMEDFQDIYQSLPGDISNVTVLPDPSSTTNRLFGGNGDGNIDTTTVLNTRAIPNENTNESLQFWQHLVQAKVLQGNFNGQLTSQFTPTNGSMVGGVPAGSFDGSGYNVASDPVLGIVIEFAGFSSTANNLAILLPKEASSIDQKLDDGFPATGIVRGVAGAGTAAGSCFTGVGMASKYTLSVTTPTCRLQFLTSKKALVTQPGSINTCDDLPIGTTRVSLTKACPVGYIGDIIEACDVNGNWVSMRQTCQMIKCSDEKSYNDTRVIPCPEGYTGTITQTCQLTGNWLNNAATPCTIP